MIFQIPVTCERVSILFVLSAPLHGADGRPHLPSHHISGERLVSIEVFLRQDSLFYCPCNYKIYICLQHNSGLQYWLAFNLDLMKAVTRARRLRLFILLQSAVTDGRGSRPRLPDIDLFVVTACAGSPCSTSLAWGSSSLNPRFLLIPFLYPS